LVVIAAFRSGLRPKHTTNPLAGYAAPRRRQALLKVKFPIQRCTGPDYRTRQEFLYFAGKVDRSVKADLLERNRRFSEVRELTGNR
jgi:hypothetical protein